MLLGLGLGPLVEQDLRRSLAMSSGDFSIFLTRQIAMGILALIALIAVIKLIALFPRRRLTTD